MKRIVLFGSFLLATSTLVFPAAAHIALMSPAPRYDELKDGPCGRGGSADKRGSKVSTYRPGSKITVTWKETVEHPGYYRISFDPNGQNFPDPKSFDDKTTTTNVVMDRIKDDTGYKTYSQEITLPDVECDKCTLQVIQMMTDKPPYGDGNDLYYQCADIKLSNDAPATAEEPPPEESGSSGTPTRAAPSTTNDGGCASSRSSTSNIGAGEPALALVAMVTLTRRRRSR